MKIDRLYHSLFFAILLMSGLSGTHQNSIFAQITSARIDNTPESSARWAVPHDQYAQESIPIDQMIEEEEEEEEEESDIWDQLEWELAAGGFLHGNVNSNENFRSQTDACFSVDIGCAAPIGKRGVLYGLAECGYGEGIDGRIETFSGFTDETDPDERLRITEFWYEHHFENNWRLRVGQVDLTTDFDCNDYANTGFEQFNSTGFVNNLAFDVPDNTFGGMLWKDFNGVLAVGAGYQSTNEWDDAFDHGFGILEVDLNTNLAGLPGVWRFYGWLNNSTDYEDKTNTGWGGSFNQDLSPRLGLWARVGFQDKNLNDYDTHISGGLEFHKFNPMRENDVIGIGYGILTLTPDYRDSLETESGNENFLESYYRFQLNDYSHLAPYVQWVKNPLGNRESGDVFVVGLRGAIIL